MSYLDKSGLQRLWSKLKRYFETKDEAAVKYAAKDEAFTKTIGGMVNLTRSTTITLDIGFTPKYFEFSGIDTEGVYLRWNKTDGWVGIIGPLYDYEVDSGANTITISTHVSAGKFIWRAFG